MKYALMRLGHYPERWLKRRLYLDFRDGAETKYRVPDQVPIPAERLRPSLPNLAGIQIQNAGGT